MPAATLRLVQGVIAVLLLTGPAFAGMAADAPDRAAPPSRAAAPVLAKPQPIAFIDDSFSFNDTPSGEPAWSQTGMASWYGGPGWHGHRTSSGERYNQEALTAAHASLPLGSRVRVALPNSNRAVIVTINDRPGTRTRIIDLSRAAARALGILDRGVAMVTLTPAG